MRSGHLNDVAHVGSTLGRALRDLGEDAALLDPPRPGGNLRDPAEAATANGRPTDDLGVLSTRP